jgi:hypothetical protein
MVPILDSRMSLPSFARPVNWQGRSGRYYALSAEPLDRFALCDDELYLLARGPLVLWAGSGSDVIDDPQSRARFRLAIAAADRAFHVEAGVDDVERMTIVWDLEGATPVTGLNVA